MRVLDQPGMLGDVALVISEAGINIDSVYVTSRGHVVLGVDDLVGAIQVAGGMYVAADDGIVIDREVGRISDVPGLEGESSPTWTTEAGEEP